jgi:hypothetical protein
MFNINYCTGPRKQGALKDGVAKFHWRVGTAHIHYWLVPYYSTPLHKHVCCVPLETTRCEQPCKNSRMPFIGRSRSYQMSQSSFSVDSSSEELGFSLVSWFSITLCTSVTPFFSRIMLSLRSCFQRLFLG